MKPGAWPKVVPPLTAEQQAINDDFVHYWHEVLPARYRVIEDFNHKYPVRHAPREFLTTLELGAGLGTHLNYERLSPEQERNYTALELRENMVAGIRDRFPNVRSAL